MSKFKLKNAVPSNMEAAFNELVDKINELELKLNGKNTKEDVKKETSDKAVVTKSKLKK